MVPYVFLFGVGQFPLIRFGMTHAVWQLQRYFPSGKIFPRACQKTPQHPLVGMSEPDRARVADVGVYPSLTRGFSRPMLLGHVSQRKGRCQPVGVVVCASCENDIPGGADEDCRAELDAG